MIQYTNWFNSFYLAGEMCRRLEEPAKIMVCERKRRLKEEDFELEQCTKS